MTSARAARFSPLFLGARLSTAEASTGSPSTTTVSVPSSSGHDFQPDTTEHPSCSITDVSVPSSSGHDFQLWNRAVPGSSHRPFQSPLPRGTTFNALVRLAELALVDGFSPLFLGARLSTMHGR